MQHYGGIVSFCLDNFQSCPELGLTGQWHPLSVQALCRNGQRMEKDEKTLLFMLPSQSAINATACGILATSGSSAPWRADSIGRIKKKERKKKKAIIGQDERGSRVRQLRRVYYVYQGEDVPLFSTFFPPEIVTLCISLNQDPALVSWIQGQHKRLWPGGQQQGGHNDFIFPSSRPQFQVSFFSY